MAAPAARDRVVGDYVILERLGKGAQGKVYRASHAVTGAAVAVKTLDLALLTPERRSRAETEVASLRSLPPHAHVVPLLDVLWDVPLRRKRSPDSKRVMALILALAGSGEMTDYLLLDRFTEDVARTYFKQLMDAIAHCHANAVAHRDLKPDNIVLDAGFNLCVTDFGLAKLLEDPYSHLRSQVGTKKGGYMAPEVVARRLYLPEPVDVWAAGVILFIMLAGFPPMDVAGGDDWWYKRLAEGNHRMFWMAHERSASFSREAKDLLQAMLAVDPSRRIRIEDALKHPFCGGATVDGAALRTEMYARRRRICAEKGILLPLEDTVAAATATVTLAVEMEGAIAAPAAVATGSGSAETPSSNLSSSSVSMNDAEAPFARVSGRRSMDVSVSMLPDRTPGHAGPPLHAARDRALDDVPAAAALDALCPAHVSFETAESPPPPSRLTWFYHTAADADARQTLLRDIARVCIGAGAVVAGDDLGAASPRARLHVSLPNVDASLHIRVLVAPAGVGSARTLVDVRCEGSDRMHGLSLYRRLLATPLVAAAIVGRDDSVLTDPALVLPQPFSIMLDRTVTDHVNVL